MGASFQQFCEVCSRPNTKLIGGSFGEHPLFAGHLADFPVDMVGQAVVSMVELSTMTLQLGSFGSRIKYLSAPVRPLWVNNVSNNGCTTLLAPKLNTIMVTMVSSRRRNTAKIVMRRCSRSLSLVLELNIKTPRQSGPYRQLCIWHELSWFIRVCTGRTWVLMTSPCGHLLSNMRCGFTTASQIISLALLLWNY